MDARPPRPLRKTNKPVVCSLYWPAFCCCDKDLPSLAHRQKRVILSHVFRPSWSLWLGVCGEAVHHGGVGDGRSHVVEQNSSCPDQNVKAKRMFSYYGFQLSKANPRGPRDIPPTEGYRISLDCHSDAQALGGGASAQSL